jgi:hypothetical protein
MPLLDPFHPPLSQRRHWDGMHSASADALCRPLNERLPSRFFAGAHPHDGGRIEVFAADSTRVEYGLAGAAVGSPRPAMPLWIGSEECVPLDLEQAYSDLCTMLRIL